MNVTYQHERAPGASIGAGALFALCDRYGLPWPLNTADGFV
jgi:hypothetical protein